MLRMSRIIEGQARRTGIDESVVAHRLFPGFYPAPEVEKTEGDSRDGTADTSFSSNASEPAARDGANRVLAQAGNDPVVNRVLEYFPASQEGA